jgi:hypothetical protein
MLSFFQQNGLFCHKFFLYPAQQLFLLMRKHPFQLQYYQQPFAMIDDPGAMLLLTTSGEGWLSLAKIRITPETESTASNSKFG